MDPRAFAAMIFTIVVWGVGPVFLRTLSVELGPADHLAIRYAIVTAIYVRGLADLRRLAHRPGRTGRACSSSRSSA